MNEEQVAAGQVWIPKHPGPGVDLVRIVCRYPFSTPEPETMWIVEYVPDVHRIERLPEKTLRDMWRLSSATPLE